MSARFRTVVCLNFSEKMFLSKKFQRSFFRKPLKKSVAMTSPTMFALMLATALFSARASAASPPSKAILATLEAIPAVGDVTVLARIKQCGMRVDGESFTDVQATDHPKTGDLRGDLMIWIVIDVPPPEGFKGPKSKYAGLTAGWRKRDDKYEALTEWAKNLQTVAGPMEWVKCQGA